jgi:hypothetical protein
MWHLLEPLHAALYYAPEAFEEAARLGYPVETRWPSYFAWRSAPLGAAGPELVAATYYSFSPRMVSTHIPAAWTVATPQQVLSGRLQAVDRFYRRVLGDRIDGPELAEAAKLARLAAEAANPAGRPLAAANADLPWPDEPHLALWQAATVLREHRGDGHIAALLTAGLDPCESLVSFAAVGAAPAEVFASREWTDDEWSAARDRLAARGWLDGDGSATTRGHEGRDAVERLTDELAGGPWRTLGPAGTGRLTELVMPLMMAVVGSGILPRQSTLGITRSGN